MAAHARDVNIFISDPDATLDDLHEAVRTLEDLQRTARRVLGSAHPVAVNIDLTLRESQEVLCLARKTGDVRITQAVQHLYNLRTPFREDGTQLVVSVRREDKPLPVETEDGDADDADDDDGRTTDDDDDDTR